MLHFLPEIESDMSVFHRIEDIYVMDAALFFRRVQCLTAYDGALAAQYERQQAERRQGTSSTPTPSVTPEDAAWGAAFAKMFPGQQVTTVGAQKLLADYSAGRG